MGKSMRALKRAFRDLEMKMPSLDSPFTSKSDKYKALEAKNELNKERKERNIELDQAIKQSADFRDNIENLQKKIAELDSKMEEHFKSGNEKQAANVDKQIQLATKQLENAEKKLAKVEKNIKAIQEDIKDIDKELNIPQKGSTSKEASKNVDTKVKGENKKIVDNLSKAYSEAFPDSKTPPKQEGNVVKLTFESMDQAKSFFEDYAKNNPGHNLSVKDMSGKELFAIKDGKFEDKRVAKNDVALGLPADTPKDVPEPNKTTPTTPTTKSDKPAFDLDEFFRPDPAATATTQSDNKDNKADLLDIPKPDDSKRLETYNAAQSTDSKSAESTEKPTVDPNETSSNTPT